MKKKNIITAVAGLIMAVLGLLFASMSRGAAMLPTPETGDQLLFALSLILTLIGILTVIAAFLPERQPVKVRTLTLAAMFAALCYVGFVYLGIKIPVSLDAGSPKLHMGNVFCVLAALILGGFWGGMAGAVGMTIADLTTEYVTSAPKTFLLKLGIGLVTGLIAHKVFQLSRDKARKVSLPVATVLSCTAGMAFNVVADPLVGYYYKMYVLGVPQKAADIWLKIGTATTAVNAVIAVIAATLFYLALRPALKRGKLLPEI